MLLKIINKTFLNVLKSIFFLIAQFCVINIQTIDEDHKGLFQQYASIYFYYPLVLNLLVQFKLKVTHEKPIMKIQEDIYFIEHFRTTASVLKTVWSKR